MSSQLRAVVIGAGYAGEGHTRALRHLGVEVVAICARQPEIVRAVARRLEVPEASTDWRATIERVRPDVVTLATPASLRAEPVEVACQRGCHVVVEKAFASNEPEARHLLALVEKAGVKHAFAVIHCYTPTTVYAAELVREGAIGTLREVELTFRFPFYTPLRPWTYVDSLAAGGGLLAAAVIHKLPQLERMVGGQIVRATGEARLARERAPYVSDIHDFRDVPSRTPTAEEASCLEWRACDVDGACTALLRLASPTPGGADVRAVIVSSAMGPATYPENGWRLYGDEGTLMVPDSLESENRLSLQPAPGARPEVLAVPEPLVEAVPRVGDRLTDRWAALFRDFLADVRGEPHPAYPTFRDGWRYQVVIDAIRAGEGWKNVPT